MLQQTAGASTISILRWGFAPCLAPQQYLTVAVSVEPEARHALTKSRQVHLALGQHSLGGAAGVGFPLVNTIASQSNFSISRLQPSIFRRRASQKHHHHLPARGKQATKMAWRNQGITGSNNIPLGKRRFGGESNDSDARNDSFSNGSDRELKRGRSPEPRTCTRNSQDTWALDTDHHPGTDADGPRRRKKRNRWGDANENKAAGLMGLPTAIVANMTSEQLEAYTLHLRIEEISQKLKIDDVVPADGDR